MNSLPEIIISGFEKAPLELERAMTAIPDPLLPLEGKEEWSLHKTLFFMCAVNENIYIPRLKAILETSNPLFQDFDTDAWMETNYDHDPRLKPQVGASSRDGSLEEEMEVYDSIFDSMEVLVNKFAIQCNETAALLGSLSEVEWDLIGTHPVLGMHNLEWWTEKMLVTIENRLSEIRGE